MGDLIWKRRFAEARGCVCTQGAMRPPQAAAARAAFARGRGPWDD